MFICSHLQNMGENESDIISQSHFLKLWRKVHSNIIIPPVSKIMFNRSQIIAFNKLLIGRKERTMGKNYYA